ncbi:MAG: hypothetical protein ABIS30_03850 [Gallionella sp.]|jgi:hypothetical protein
MNLSRTEVEAELVLLSPADWQRIKTMARAYCRGLAYLTPEDLIQETYTKLLACERAFPRGVRQVVVVINAMHSEASNCREREKSGAIDYHVDVSSMSQPMEDDEGTALVIPKNEITPDRILEARREFSAIEALVAGDADLQDVVAAWSLELKGKEATEYLGWEMNRYEAARKRLVRRLDTMKRE